MGGANLLLRGAIARPTKDADLIGERLANGQIVKLSEVPPGLARAVSDVAATYGLDRDWMNVGPSSLMDFELPDGFLDRLWAKRFDSLTLWLAGEFDMICFKLYAVVDQWPRPGRHLEDLESLDEGPFEGPGAGRSRGFYRPLPLAALTSARHRSRTTSHRYSAAT